MKNTMATLPCPHPEGDVTWSRYINGKKVTLVTIKNGREIITDKRYGSLADHSLVITNVKSYDSAMYHCNHKEIYLHVITDPNMVVPNAQPEGGNVPVTPINDIQGFGLAPDQRGKAADTESSDIWKVPVGAVIGAALMLLAMLTLRFCTKKRAERSTNLDKTVTEPPKTKSKKAVKGKSSAVVDGLSTDEMSKDQLEEHIVRLREELDREREERSYFQLERDKIQAFWEISKRNLEETKAELRNRRREREEAEERHRVEITVYKQKLKHVLSEHHDIVSELKMNGVASTALTRNQQTQSELKLRRDVHGLQADVREKERHNDNCVKELELQKGFII
eukprot:superscaffoldBa00009163_g23905